MNFKNILKQFKYVKNHRVTLFWIFVFSLILTVSSLFHTMLLSVVIDKILVVKDASALGIIILLIVAIYALQVLVKYVVGYLGLEVTQIVSVKLRTKVFSSLLHKKMSALLKENNSEMVSTIITDTQLISNFICTKPIQILNAFLTIGLTIALIFALNAKMAIIAITSIVIQLVISFYLSSVAKKNQQEIRTKESQHLNILKQLVAGIKYIKAYRTEKYNKNKYFDFLRETYALGERTYNISYIYSTVTSVLSFLGSMVIFTVGVIEIMDGNLTIGVLFVYDTLINTLYGGINSISTLFFDLNKITVSCDRIDKIFQLEQEESGEELTDERIESIDYKDICFNYGDKNVLQNISLNFVKGEPYAIIGKSGVGKSTLISLLARFFDPDNGSIKLNNVDIRLLNLRDVREKLTFVFQEGIIVDGSVKDNIKYGNKRCTEEQLERVVRICCIDEMCEKLENGLDTYICQEANNVSGGQKQRIFLARALLRESDVFVFDEAFSQIDKQLERRIVKGIIDEYSDKVLIFITHNVALINDFPQIKKIVLEEGEKAVCGSHQELMKMSKTYRDLLRRDTVNES